MNLRCTYCQMPFTIGRAELLAALQSMEAEKLHHYDAHCPRCRKANSISRERLEMFFPNWRQVAQEQATMEAAPAPVAAPAPAKPEEVVEKPSPARPRKRAPAKSKTRAKAAAVSSSKGKKTVAKSKKAS